MKSLPFALLASFALFVSAIAHADTLHLTDGSRVNGDIIQFTSATLTIQTDFAGELSIPGDKIAGFETAEPVVVVLDSGERLIGRLEQTDDGQVLVSERVGTVALQPADLAGLYTTDAPVADADAQVVELRQEYEDKLAEIEAREKKLEDLWSGRFEIGFNGQSGNKERLSFNGRAETKRETDSERLLLYVEGHYAEDNNERSVNEIFGGANLEVDLTQRWFAYGRLKLEYDEFEDLDLRTVLTAGMGYFFIQEEDHEWKGRVGVGYQHESFDDGMTEDEAILELGYDFRKDINEWFRFTHSLTLYPSLTDNPTESYRLFADAAIEMPITKDKAWRVRTGVRGEYDSEPAEDVEKMDTFYFLNFVYDWD